VRLLGDRSAGSSYRREPFTETWEELLEVALRPTQQIMQLP
jgi:hypothetical protein